MKQEDKYLPKVERFISEEEFISNHTMGLKVEDDATNIEKITGKGVIQPGEADFLRQMNGVRNFIVHRYDRIDMDVVNEALSRIDELKGIVIKVAEY